MKKILIFAGTSEGRTICEQCIRKKIKVDVCVATEYGEIVLPDSPYIHVFVGRLQEEQMEEIMKEKNYDLVIDCTHPYATIVTNNIKAACRKDGSSYLRCIRESMELEMDHVVYVANVEQAAAYLSMQTGNALVTTGSKEIATYTTVPNYEQRLYFRVLPTEEAIKECERHNITKSHLLCMQGPFSLNLNVAMLQQYKAQYLVTKESGQRGGFLEKAEAAKRAGATLLVIKRPRNEQGSSLAEIIDKLEQIAKEGKIT